MPSYQPVRTSAGLAPTHAMAVTAVMTVSRTAKTKGSGSHRLKDLCAHASRFGLSTPISPFNSPVVWCGIII